MVSLVKAKSKKERNRYKILSLDNVIGTSTYPTSKLTQDDWSIAIYTIGPYTGPSEIDGVPVKVIPFSGPYPFSKQLSRNHDVWRRERLRPCVGGIAISHYKSSGYGTLGSWVRDKDTDEPLLASCWHVIANEGDCEFGDPILQPPACLGGTNPEDTIAYLHRWVDVDMIGKNLDEAKQHVREKPNPTTNVIDFALALAASDDVVARTTFEGHTYNGFRYPNVGDNVNGSGATTGYTHSRVIAIDMDVFVDYMEIGYALFLDQGLIIGIPPFTGVGICGHITKAAEILNFKPLGEIE